MLHGTEPGSARFLYCFALCVIFFFLDFLSGNLALTEL